MEAPPPPPATKPIGGTDINESDEIRALVASPALDAQTPVPMVLQKHVHHHYASAPTEPIDEQQEEGPELPPVPLYSADDEQALLPEDSIFLSDCFHCKKPIQRSYKPEKQALYSCCSNRCGLVVIHSHCVDELTRKDGDKNLVCDKCYGEIELTRPWALVELVKELWSRRQQISPRAFIKWLVYWLVWLWVAGYMYKVYWFTQILTGISLPDLNNNAWLINSTASKEDIWRYQFVPSGEPLVPLLSQERVYVPYIISSHGLHFDVGHVWITLMYPFLKYYVGIWRIGIWGIGWLLWHLMFRCCTRAKTVVRKGASHLAHAAMAAARARQTTAQQQHAARRGGGGRRRRQ
jgi:hypothetical protein